MRNLLNYRITEYIAVYGSFFVRAFSFIIIAPILSRRLGVDAWSKLVNAQVFAIWMVLVLDFGITNFSSRYFGSKRSTEEISKYLNGILTLKVMASFALIPVVAAYIAITDDSGSEKIIWLAYVWAVVQNFVPIWYYQANQRLIYLSICDIIFRICGMIIVIKFTNVDNFQIYFFAILSVFTLPVILLNRGWVAKKIKLSMSEAIGILKESKNLYSFSLVTSIYNSANLVLVSFSVPIGQSIYYANADRIIRAAVGVIAPLNQIALPVSARKFAVGRSEGLKNFKRIFMAYGAAGIFSGIIIYLAAPLIIRIMYGDEFYESLHYLRVLSLLFTLTCFNTALVYHFFIPQGMDSNVNRIYTKVSILALFLLLVIPIFYKIQSVPFIIVFVESIALILLLIDFFHQRNSYE